MPWIDWFVTDQGHHLPRHVGRAVRVLGRVGFGSRGVIYLAMALLVLLAALGSSRGELTDAQGAMQVIRDLPGGPILVFIIGLGLCGYAAWRIPQAVFNLDYHDDSWASHGWRLYYLIDGLFHLAWAVLVFLLLFTTPADGDEATREYTAQAMQVPLGRWLVGLVGAGIAVTGIYLGLRVWSSAYLKKLRMQKFNWVARYGTKALARAGETARGIVFLLFGFFLIRAAWTYDPDEARGVGESLAMIARQPFGWWLLLSVGVGILCYGIYSLVEARYREIGGSPQQAESAETGAAT